MWLLQGQLKDTTMGCSSARDKDNHCEEFREALTRLDHETTILL
jgi:hypothetical protein